MFYWIKSFTLAVFLFASDCHFKNLHQEYTKSKLHHRMSDEELKIYFGANSADEVPEYEITQPFQTNENGEFVTYELSHQHSRDRRNTADKTNVFYYHLKAFGLALHLNVSLNENLLGNKFSIETRHKNGSTSISTEISAQHFIGNVISHQGSMVAISYGVGMEGMIKLMDETFFLQPVPTHLAERHKRSLSAVPHIIYKKSAEENDVTCDLEEAVIPKRQKRHVRRSTIDNLAYTNIYTPRKYLKAMYIVDHLNNLNLSTLTNILPTLANIVAGIFRDDSFGEIKVNYILNKIIFLNNGELSYNASSSSLNKLYTMMAWVRENISESKDDPDSFDSTTLISRGGDVGGRGTLGTLCTDYGKTATVVNIAGINSAGIIAHELFHNFGYFHDGTTDCPNRKYIMSTVVSSGPASFTWSNCSRAFAQSFLSSGASDCLNDPPSTTSLRPTVPPVLKSKLPGEVYHANRQCQLLYGPTYKKCPTLQDQCGALYCTADYKKCHTTYYRPVDGTRCGVRHWCIRGVCVDDGSPIIDGKWGEWSDYGSCSRTCGRGVEFRTRKCDNPSPQNGGSDCEGSTRGQYRTCNTQACEKGSVSFREVQCSAKGAYVEYITASDRCSLTCRSGSSIYWLGTVKDGTRCYKDKNILDVCVEGHCREVGCDYKLESGKRFDRCKVCGGDGNSCGLNIVNYTKNYRGYGFGNPDTMVTLPVNTTNVVAIKKGVTYNNIGVQTIDREYLVNLPTWSKTVEAVGTTISYIHEDNRYPDRIYIPGPTTFEINLVFVWLYEANRGVDISYYSQGSAIAGATSYEWHISDWSQCSRTCAGGIKTRLIQCLRNDDKTEVGYGYCNQTSKPNTLASCNIQACPAQWYQTFWETCSLPCGRGSQSRSVVCRRKLSESEWETLVNESACTEPKPQVSPLVRNCNELDCPPEYFGKEWSKCSTTCSPGIMTRKLACRRRNAQGITEILPDHWCQNYGAIKPGTTENCNMDSPCEPPPHLEIGCFQLSTTIFPTVLANFWETLDYDNILVTARACAKLAFLKNYTYFGLANNGECRVGPNMKSNFFKPPTSGECNSFVGKMNAIFVYTLAQLPKVSPVGCYTDKSERALPILLKNFRNQINWYEMDRTVNQCAHVAYSSGHQYFSVQFYGECWTGTNAKDTYNRYGNNAGCWSGVGEHWTNFVYKLE